jgi:hypothetical protein
VPGLFCRASDGFEQVRIAMAQKVHPDAGVEIKEARAVCREQAHALTSFKGKFGPGIGAVERGHDRSFPSNPAASAAPKTKKRAATKGHVPQLRYGGG